MSLPFFLQISSIFKYFYAKVSYLGIYGCTWKHVTTSWKCPENSVVCVVNIFFFSIWELLFQMNMNHDNSLYNRGFRQDSEYCPTWIQTGCDFFFLQRWKRNKTILIKVSWSRGRGMDFQIQQHIPICLTNLRFPFHGGEKIVHF